MILLSGRSPLLESFFVTMNIYDNEEFFTSYIALRNGQNYNDLLETPAMLSLIGDVKGKDILDIGCGFGKTDSMLIDMGASSVIGIDKSEKMIRKAMAENSRDRIEYMVMDAEDITLPSNAFDIVYSSLCFHYIEDYSSLLRNIHRMLKSGGMLLFSQEHPITTADYDGSFSSDNRSYTFSSYQKEGKRCSTWFVDGVITYHRTFSTILTELVQNHFNINTVLEPKPTENAIKELPRIIREYEKPSFLIVKSYKI